MSKWPSVCMKFFRKNGEPAMKTKSGQCFSSRLNVLRNRWTNRPAEMIINQEMDVGDERRQRDLVQEHPQDDSGIDGQHQAPGIFPHPEVHLSLLVSSRPSHRVALMRAR